MCVFVCALRLYSATPGLGVGVCVCVCVCMLRLYPATPGWGVRCGCVCLGSGFGCAPLLLAGVFGCVCVFVRALLVPRHSWLACALWVCVLALGCWLRPATPGWGVGVCLCLCASSPCTPLLLAGVCVVGVCAWARVSAATHHSWLGCWGPCVFFCALRLYPATPGWGVRCGSVCLGSGFGCAPPLLAGVLGFVCVFVRAPLVPPTPGSGVRCGCVCLGSGFGCAPPLLAGVLGCVCVCVSAPLVPCHSWLGCAVWVCVLGLGFRLRATTPSWGVGVCLCLCACFSCTLPFLAGLCSLGVCAWARISGAPRHYWVGCWGVCVCVCVRAPLVPRHSWLGCAVWVCLLGLGFLLRPATPGWGVGVCACLCARSACTPLLLAGVCGVGLCALAWFLAAPRRSWLGCRVVCVFVCALRLYPATAGWGVRCGCVCLGSGFGCAPPLLARVLGCVCVCVRAPLLPRQSWLGRVVLVCVLGFGSRLRPATPGSALGGGCVCVRAPLVPRHSWLGCAVWP